MEDLAAERKELEELAVLMAEIFGEELYQGDEESTSNNGVENDEEVDYCRTRYIEWEANEVIDLVSNDDDSGYIWVFFFLFKQTKTFNVFNVF